MSKKDAPARYIAGLLAYVKHYTDEPPPVPKTFEGIFIPPNGSFSDPTSWEPVRAAFKAFKRDPRKAEDWETLIYSLAYAHFGKPRHKPKIWEEATLCQLWADFVRMRVRYAGKSQRQICKILVTDYPHYNRSDADTIRRRQADARKAFIKHVTEHKEAWIQGTGLPWTPAQEKKLAEQTVKEWDLRLTGVTTLSDLWSE
jgi:hypothetical protein